MGNRKHTNTTQLATMFDLFDKHLSPSWIDENGVKTTSYKEGMTDERIGLLIDPKGSINSSMVANRREELYGKLYRIKAAKPKTIRQMIGELQVEVTVLRERLDGAESLLRINRHFPKDQELTDIEDVSQVG
jgi:hypothetical protein